MIKPDGLEIVCKELFEYSPQLGEWDKMVLRLRENSTFKKKRAFTAVEYAKYFSETLLDLSLEKLVKKFTQWNISLKPISAGTITDDHIFYYDNFGRYFAFFRKKENCYEYDKIITIEGKPVIFEVKLGRWGRPKFVKQKRRLGGIIYRQGMGIKNSLRPEVYEPKIDAVRQALDSDVGYVFIIPKDIYYKLDKGELESIIYSEFKKNNGLVIPFYTDRHTFQSEVIQKVLEYNLKVRPEPQKSL